MAGSVRSAASDRAMVGTGFVDRIVTEDEVRSVVADGVIDFTSRSRVLVLLPDSTRHAPVPLLFRLLTELVGRRVARLDFLIALGTHPPMSAAAIERLVGLSATERVARYPNTAISNHAWDQDAQMIRVGLLSAERVAELTEGLLQEEIPVDLNRTILDYDHLVICGPVFPHEVAGFSGGNKYIVPGIAGPQIISATHWLGALVSSMRTIGIKDTAVRRVIDQAAALVPIRVTCIALVVRGEGLHGIWVGESKKAWSRAADLSAELEIVRVPRPFRRVLSMPSPIYEDLWTAAKAMYKTEPAIADGGEVVIYAPHLTEISFTHGRLIDEVGYHVLEYFTKQPDRFASVPGVIKAHSTHVKGAGSYDASHGAEHPRIQVTLATGISAERCQRVNLGYMDPRSIDPTTWEGREEEGLVVIRNAGETLYRADDFVREQYSRRAR